MTYHTAANPAMPSGFSGTSVTNPNFRYQPGQLRLEGSQEVQDLPQSTSVRGNWTHVSLNSSDEGLEHREIVDSEEKSECLKDIANRRKCHGNRLRVDEHRHQYAGASGPHTVQLRDRDIKTKPAEANGIHNQLPYAIECVCSDMSATDMKIRPICVKTKTHWEPQSPEHSDVDPNTSISDLGHNHATFNHNCYKMIRQPTRYVAGAGRSSVDTQKYCATPKKNLTPRDRNAYLHSYRESNRSTRNIPIQVSDDPSDHSSNIQDNHSHSLVTLKEGECKEFKCPPSLAYTCTSEASGTMHPFHPMKSLDSLHKGYTIQNLADEPEITSPDVEKSFRPYEPNREGISRNL